MGASGKEISPPRAHGEVKVEGVGSDIFCSSGDCAAFKDVKRLKKGLKS